jgi:hypothetical protein
MGSFGRTCCGLAILCLTSGADAADQPYHLRGMLVAIDDQVLTIENEDEEQTAVGLTDATGIYLVTPAKFADIKIGQYVGVTSVDSNGQRVALEVHVFAEDLRGTGEGHHAWDLVKGPNTMTTATIAEIEEVSPVERVLRLTYQGGEGDAEAAGEQVIRVPDFADVVFLESALDPSVLLPERPVFLVVQDGPSGATALTIAVGKGVAPPM